jgi:hypothetical protein
MGWTFKTAMALALALVCVFAQGANGPFRINVDVLGNVSNGGVENVSFVCTRPVNAKVALECNRTCENAGWFQNGSACGVPEAGYFEYRAYGISKSSKEVSFSGPGYYGIAIDSENGDVAVKKGDLPCAPVAGLVALAGCALIAGRKQN